MQQLCGVFYRCEEYAWLLHEIDYVRISLTHEKYWYEIRDVLVPILHALWGIGTNPLRRANRTNTLGRKPYLTLEMDEITRHGEKEQVQKKYPKNLQHPVQRRSPIQVLTELALLNVTEKTRALCFPPKF